MFTPGGGKRRKSGNSEGRDRKSSSPKNLAESTENKARPKNTDEEEGLITPDASKSKPAEFGSSGSTSNSLRDQKLPSNSNNGESYISNEGGENVSSSDPPSTARPKNNANSKSGSNSNHNFSGYEDSYPGYYNTEGDKHDPTQTEPGLDTNNANNSSSGQEQPAPRNAKRGEKIGGGNSFDTNATDTTSNNSSDNENIHITGNGNTGNNSTSCSKDKAHPQSSPHNYTLTAPRSPSTNQQKMGLYANGEKDTEAQEQQQQHQQVNKNNNNNVNNTDVNNQNNAAGGIPTNNTHPEVNNPPNSNNNPGNTTGGKSDNARANRNDRGYAPHKGQNRKSEQRNHQPEKSCPKLSTSDVPTGNEPPNSPNNYLTDSTSDDGTNNNNNINNTNKTSLEKTNNYNAGTNSTQNFIPDSETIINDSFERGSTLNHNLNNNSNNENKGPSSSNLNSLKDAIDSSQNKDSKSLRGADKNHRRGHENSEADSNNGNQPGQNPINVENPDQNAQSSSLAGSPTSALPSPNVPRSCSTVDYSDPAERNLPGAPAGNNSNPHSRSESLRLIRNLSDRNLNARVNNRPTSPNTTGHSTTSGSNPDLLSSDEGIVKESLFSNIAMGKLNFIDESDNFEKLAHFMVVPQGACSASNLGERLFREWKLERPKLIISVSGWTKASLMPVIPPRQLLRLKQGLLRTVQSTNTWILSTGITHG